jgi:hypothetical protein
MEGFKKHVGRNHLGTRLVVVFREIPDDEAHCLVVESDSLPEMYHDQLMREVDSRDAQQTVDLFEVLQRRSFGDGGQMLNTLHARGFIKKYPVEQIEMVPMPNRPVALSIINEQIKTGAIASEKAEGGEAEAELPTSNDAGVSVDTDTGLIKPVVIEPVKVGNEQGDATKAAAESKLLQARLMEEDAKKMREEAYALDPDLKKGGRPSKKQAKKVAEAKSGK